MSAADAARLKALYGLDQSLACAIRSAGRDRRWPAILGYSRLFAAPVLSGAAAAPRQLARC